MKLSRLFSFILILLAGLNLQAQEDWTALFNGKNLKGWKQLNGTAKYRVQDNMIIGSTVLKSPNSFLCTEKDYGDFVLEFEVWVDPQLNSGVQIRSHSLKEYQNGRVHGYQIEIDPSERAWTAGIYDEARRAWLYPLTDNPDARQAFRNGEWNKFHVEAIGNHLRTWINRVPAANLIDDMDGSGFIALQVHGVGNDPAKEGILVKWRNLRIATKNLHQYCWPYEKEILQISAIPNTLTDQEIRAGWKLLWDGKTSNGWRGANKKVFPEKGWSLSGGILSVMPSDGGESTNGGDIVTIDTYGNFEFSVDFRLTQGANSGIKYFVEQGLNGGVGSAIGLEFQLLDDSHHPDANNGVGGNRTIASLYDLIPALESKVVNPPGQWNTARILVQGSHVEHWLNGMKVVEYERGTQIYRALVQKSKYAGYPNFGEAAKGYLLLQDHGNEVSFRNIKILVTSDQ